MILTPLIAPTQEQLKPLRDAATSMLASIEAKPAPTFEYIDTGHVHLAIYSDDTRALRDLAEVVKTLLLEAACRHARAASNSPQPDTLRAQDNSQDAPPCSDSKP